MNDDSISDSQPQRRTGGCLCGAVRFEVTVPEASFDICHCSMCRRWSAGPLMSVHCLSSDAAFSGERAPGWYRGSEWGERGFCPNCGSSLFWRIAGEEAEKMDALAVAVDAFDEGEDFRLARHIFADFRPPRYEFADDRPRVTEAELLAELGFGPPDGG